MKFKDSKTDEAVSLLKTKADGKDLRRAPRRDIRASITISTMNSANAELRDLSARGARLWVAQPIEPGVQFVLNLPAKPGHIRSPITCTVVHCRKDPAGGFTVGVEFVGSVQQRAKVSDEAEAQSKRIRASILS